MAALNASFAGAKVTAKAKKVSARVSARAVKPVRAALAAPAEVTEDEENAAKIAEANARARGGSDDGAATRDATRRATRRDATATGRRRGRTFEGRAATRFERARAADDARDDGARREGW